MKKKKKLYEGKTKKLYAIEEQEQLIQEFKDDISSSDGNITGTIKGKGATNKQISATLFEYLEGFNIQTHFVKDLGPREMLIRRLEMIPVELLMRNIAIGSFSERFGLVQGEELKCPIMEFYLKDPAHQHPMINQSHMIAFKMATADEVKMIERMASKINAILKSYFMRRNIKLIDFKLEFGRYNNKILLGDEITPDTCTLWDVHTQTRIETDVTRTDSGTAEKAYDQLKNRLIS
ncbi:MAG: phosphoribosylaminoimidazolesuccinocarboxamide synthase [Candidatus Zhuqueibacterota bacterium]